MPKILIIEDDQIVANIYRNKLSVEGYTVETAGDGQAGLEMLRNFRPQVVILDLMLPKLSGVEVMKQIRAQSEFKSLPVIVFSNTYLTNMVQQAWKAGATKCLSKASCSPKHLLDVVRSTLGGGPEPVNGSHRASGSHGPTGGPAAVDPGAPGVPHPAAPPSAHAAAGPVTREPHPHPASGQSAAAFRKTFLEGFPAALASLRASLQSLIKTTDEQARLSLLADIRQRVHGLTGNAGLCELNLLATTADALAALLQELYDRPKNINPSVLRTVAGAIDFLGTLADHGRSSSRQDLPPAKILVVDDEPISRRAVVSALERAHLKANAVEDAETALTLLSGGKFDLVFLDIDMPGMNGHELCAKLRTMPQHQHTPVIFVTGLSGFEARANSMMSGGSDFIAKPFVSLELAVKALVFLLRAQLEKPRPAQALQPAG